MNLIAAAGEVLLAKGDHGSLGVFAGFAIPTFANTLMLYVMIKAAFSVKLLPGLV